MRIDASGGGRKVFSKNLARVNVGCHCGRPQRLGSSAGEEPQGGLKSGSGEKGNRGQVELPSDSGCQVDRPRGQRRKQAVMIVSKSCRPIHPAISAEH